MRETQSGLNESIEQLAMLSLLPEVKDAVVLDLGCGSGELCRRLVKMGAESVTGVDISSNMLALAAKEPLPNITYLNQAMEDVQFEPQSFDLIVSSLAFHYVEDLSALFEKIHDWLRPQGILIFSIEHPIATSCQGIHRGWVKDAAGKKLYWPLDCYSREGKRESHWFVEGVIKYHRTLSALINSLIGAGLTILATAEPSATEEDQKQWPELTDTVRRPPFLFVKAQRRDV